MQKSDTLKSCFGAAIFVVVLQLSQNNVLIELACDRYAFLHRDLNSWTLISEKNSIQKLRNRSYSFGNTWASGILSGPYSVGNLLLWSKIIHPGLITSDYIIKSLFTIFWVHFEKLFSHCYTRLLLLICSQMGYPSCIYLSKFKVFLQKLHELLLTTS